MESASSVSLFLASLSLLLVSLSLLFVKDFLLSNHPKKPSRRNSLLPQPLHFSPFSPKSSSTAVLSLRSPTFSDTSTHSTDPYSAPASPPSPTPLSASLTPRSATPCSSTTAPPSPTALPA
ncbi:hypothetical protein KSP39_PZI016391 [Platanthera zijinensis]|uniref:Uncharacterized protein n=1 Tax=Platanthera zijinensis TaxID=2320716 RepID=A0AAP0G0D4_9ASPA